jgi:hypothetical protein
MTGKTTDCAFEHTFQGRQHSESTSQASRAHLRLVGNSERTIVVCRRQHFGKLVQRRELFDCYRYGSSFAVIAPGR